MADPKPRKKLSTGPINIAKPRFPVSVSPESGLIDSGKQESANIESINPENSLEDSISVIDLKDSEKQVGAKQDSELQESRKKENTLPEKDYQKVAMRLSGDSVEQLRRLKSDTGIPYEVIVDSIIGKWSGLPQDIKESILEDASEERFFRLMSGQEKALATTRERMEQAKGKK